MCRVGTKSHVPLIYSRTYCRPLLLTPGGTYDGVNLKKYGVVFFNVFYLTHKCRINVSYSKKYLVELRERRTRYVYHH